MVASDFSENATQALKAGYSWAKQLGLDCRMVVVSKVAFTDGKFMQYHSKDSARSIHWQGDTYLSEMIKKQVESADIPMEELKVDVFLGKIEETIIEQSQKNDAILFLGAKGHSVLSSILLGSVCEKVAHLSKVPTVIVKSAWPPIPKKIMVGVDPELGLEQILEQTKNLAKKLKSEVVFAHVVSEVPTYFFEETEQFEHALKDFFEGENRRLRKYLEPISQELSAEGIKNELVFRDSGKHRVCQELLSLSQDMDCDLICLQHNRNRSKYSLLGCTAMETIRKSKQNILIMS